MITDHVIYSESLHRSVTLSVILPAHYNDTALCRLILFNDGQDLRSVPIERQIRDLLDTDFLKNVIIVGIHSDHNRLQEYGTALKTDYANRGSLAGSTTDFVLKELLLYFEQAFKVKTTDIIYAGFSLGGLMALDIAWNNPACFSGVAIFSGALWWRERSIQDGYQDSDRIMHAQIRSALTGPNLRFWFQTGTCDEVDDRDHDGVIDSIQDTLDCISELEKKGYRWGKEVSYVEINGGEHHIGTWAMALPDFFKWAYEISNVP